MLVVNEEEKLDGVAPLIADPSDATPPIFTESWLPTTTEMYILTGTAYLPSLVKQL